MENDKGILIMEYGQYLTEESEMQTKIIFGSGSNSSNNPRIKTDEAKHWYINGGGVRLTKINFEYFFREDSSKIVREEIDFTFFKIIIMEHHMKN